MTSTSEQLRYSPAARAFFAALDSSKDGSSSLTSKKQSSFIQKRIQTLGWRNRYSQDAFYPITLQHAITNNSKEPCSFQVRQVQRGEVEGTYGTGATVWPASMVLLKYLEKHACSLLEKKHVVDLGSGTGVTSFAAALLGASHVICTDGEPPVVQLAKDNLQLVKQQLPNDVIVDVELYWWGSGPTPGGDGFCDVVLVSDCVLPKLYPIAPLVEAIDQLLSKPKSVAILSYEIRYYPEYDPRVKFRELASSKGLLVEVISIEEQHSVYSTDDIEIWHVRRRSKSVV